MSAVGSRGRRHRVEYRLIQGNELGITGPRLKDDATCLTSIQTLAIDQDDDGSHEGHESQQQLPVSAMVEQCPHGLSPLVSPFTITTSKGDALVKSSYFLAFFRVQASRIERSRTGRTVRNSGGGDRGD